MRRLMVVGMVALAAGLGGCGSDSVTNPVVQSSMAGTWSLVSMDGYTLPFIVAQVGSDNFAILSDVITADSSGGFAELTTVQALVNGQVTLDTIPDGGTYVISGTSVGLTYKSDGSTAMGTVIGNTLSLTDGSGNALTYLKQ